jgi:hypothetical protein
MTQIRQATLDDTQAISALFRARVAVWQRQDAQGNVQEVQHDQLTIYERWLHGGAWMSVETAVLLLSHLIRTRCPAFVAQADDGQIVGYLEAYPGEEAAPYGRVLHIRHVIGADDTMRVDLLAAARQIATAQSRQLTVSFSGYDRESSTFFTAQGFEHLETIVQYTLVAQAGRSFYKATDHPAAEPAQITGWGMPVGRMESAHTHWHLLWPGLWDALDEVTAQRTHRLAIHAAGQDAFVCIQQGLYTPRTAQVYCWSPKPLTSQLLVSLRDWAYRQDYRTLAFSVPERTAKLFGPDAETTPYQQAIFTAAQ